MPNHPRPQTAAAEARQAEITGKTTGEQVGIAAEGYAESVRKFETVKQRELARLIGKPEGLSPEVYELRLQRPGVQAMLADLEKNQQPAITKALTEYYEAHKDELFYNEGLLKFRLIDIDMSKVEITDLEENRAEKARKKGQELANRARTGEDFAKLAEEYSDGHRKSFGGLWPEVQPDSLAMPYVVLAEAAEEMNSGEIAGPLETVGHIFLMKLEAKQPAGYQPLDEVQGEVNNRILAERRNEAVIRLNAKLLREAEIGSTDEFVDFCVDKIYKMSTGPAKTEQESK